MVFKAFWPWIPCLRARTILEPASVLRRGLSAAFRVICSILSRVSFWIHFRLVRVYLGDQRMRRVKDQDEEGKGLGDQEDQGPRDQGTKGPEDQGTRGSGEPEIVFPIKLYFFQGLRFFPRKRRFFFRYHPGNPHPPPSPPPAVLPHPPSHHSHLYQLLSINLSQMSFVKASVCKGFTV